MNKEDGSEIVAPITLWANGMILTYMAGLVPRELQSLKTPEILSVIEKYAQAFRDAVAAGLDGLAPRCAGGYPA